MSTKIVHTLEEFEAEAVRFARALVPAEGRAALVTLSGELGAGKTAFTKAVAKALGVAETVTSPTFVLEKIYGLNDSAKFKRLIHIDAYRLGECLPAGRQGKDLAPLGFDEVMQDPGNLVLLEWPEKVAEALPPATVHIAITVLADDAREIKYD